MQKREVIVVLAVAGIVVSIIATWFAYFRPTQQEPAQEQQPDEFTREDIIRALSIPSGGPPPTEEERRQIQEALQKPSNGKPVSEEEKEAILEALQKSAE